MFVMVRYDVPFEVSTEFLNKIYRSVNLTIQRIQRAKIIGPVLSCLSDRNEARFFVLFTSMTCHPELGGKGGGSYNTQSEL